MLTDLSSLIKNDFNSGITAGFSGGVPSAIDLYVERATPIINDLSKSIKKKAKKTLLSRDYIIPNKKDFLNILYNILFDYIT